MSETGSTASERVRFIICDDHRILTDALATVARAEPWLDLVAPAVRRADEAVALTSQHRPDVVLMDVNLDGPINGIEATRRIKEAVPETKVVIMTAHDETEFLVAAVEAGASGFVDKGDTIAHVLDTVKAAADGEILIEPARLAGIMRRLSAQRERDREVELMASTLTKREREILRLLAEGMRNREIARSLYISEHTVQTHVRNILAKLGVHSKLEAVAFASRAGVFRQ